MLIRNDSAPTSQPLFSLKMKNSWLALRAAREKTARMGGNFRSSANLVQMRGLEPPRPEGH